LSVIIIIIILPWAAHMADTEQKYIFKRPGGRGGRNTSLGRSRHIRKIIQKWILRE
jgi:hypothetical protein